MDARSLIDAAVKATGRRSRYGLALYLDIEPRYIRHWYKRNRLTQVSRRLLQFAIATADVTRGMHP